MKKILAIMLALLIGAQLAACASRRAASSSSTPESSSQVEQSSEPEPEQEPEASEVEEEPESPAARALPVTIDKPHMALHPSVELGEYARYPDMLQIGETLIVRYVRDGERETRSIIEAFSLTEAKSLYTFEVESAVSRVEANSNVEGFDYRIFTSDAVLYKNSADPSKEKEISLPESIQPVNDVDIDNRGAFDQLGGRFVWAGEDGVYIANLDGSGARLVMPNSEAQQAMESQMSPTAIHPADPSVFIRPRLICGGTKIAAIIYAPSGESDDYAGGIGIYDGNQGVTNTYTGLYGINIVPQLYILNDRTLVASNWDGTTLIDAQTGESSSLPYKIDHESSFYTADYETFLVQPADPDGLAETARTKWPLYLCTEDPEDRSKLFMTITTQEDQPMFSITATEHYLVVACGRDVPAFAVVKYR